MITTITRKRKQFLVLGSAYEPTGSAPEEADPDLLAKPVDTNTLFCKV